MSIRFENQDPAPSPPPKWQYWWILSIKMKETAQIPWVTEMKQEKRNKGKGKDIFRRVGKPVERKKGSGGTDMCAPPRTPQTACPPCHSSCCPRQRGQHVCFHNRPKKQADSAGSRSQGHSTFFPACYRLHRPEDGALQCLRASTKSQRTVAFARITRKSQPVVRQLMRLITC